MASISLGGMLRQMAGMVNTKDLSDWENRFLKNVLDRTGQGARTSILTAPVRVRLKDRAGADPAEWPEHLRVQEFPA